MPFYPDFSPQNIIGVDVFLERFQTRTYVGKLERTKGQFHFAYEPSYLKMKNIIPLGPEFPLTRQDFYSPDLFSSFEERLPDPENPAYADYCTAVGIAVTTTDPIVLLSTIGKRGPSSFIFEPIYEETFSYKKCEDFNKELGLSMQDFAYLFDVSLSILQKIKAGDTSGKEVLKRLEIYLKIPEACEFQVKQNAKYLHVEKLDEILKWLELEKEKVKLKNNKWKILSYEELDYTQECIKELSSYKWADKLIKNINNLGFNQESMSTLFEIRFGYALHKVGLNVQNAYKAGVGDSDVDFLGSTEDGKKWLIELTSMSEKEEVKKNTAFHGNTFQSFSSLITPWDIKNNAEVLCLENAQKAILSKIAKKDKKTGMVSFTKFPQPQQDEYNIIIIDMRGFVIGSSNQRDYINILYGTQAFVKKEDVAIDGRYWIDSKTGEKTPFIGIFDPNYPDERAKYLQERIHGVGFIWEKDYDDGEIAASIQLFSNPKFFKDAADLNNIWPLKKDPSYLDQCSLRGYRPPLS